MSASNPHSRGCSRAASDRLPRALPRPLLEQPVAVQLDHEGHLHPLLHRHRLRDPLRHAAQ
eukprot:3648188-Pleurochrysis_carterae.AAC.1